MCGSSVLLICCTFSLLLVVIPRSPSSLEFNLNNNTKVYIRNEYERQYITHVVQRIYMSISNSRWIKRTYFSFLSTYSYVENKYNNIIHFIFIPTEIPHQNLFCTIRLLYCIGFTKNKG